MRELVTTLLDVVGLLAVAAGAGLQVYGWVVVFAGSARGLDAVAAGAGVTVFGLVVLGGVRLADSLAARAAQRPRAGRTDVA